MDVEWFAKTEDGEIYGPVGIEKLAAWVRDGRLDSTSFVSDDRVNWIPAPRKFALGMNWIVETEVGKWFGPFHHDIVEQLVKSNQIPDGSRLYRYSTLQGDDPAVAETNERLAKREAECAELKTECGELKAACEELRTECGRLRKEAARLSKENEKLTKRLGKEDARSKKGSLKDLLFGKSGADLAQIERAAQRELAAARQRSARGGAVPAAEVIDVEAIGG